MNPPPALHGAMNKDRKPFTYTPGGLDLSQIKSERMAKRLMRNAMDQGVPEHPTSNLQSPPPSLSTSLNVPNYNCLPVQVFPTFPLPANPKSLLKTRSNSTEHKERLSSQTETVAPRSEELLTDVKKLHDSKQCFADDKKYKLSYIEPAYENKNNDQCLGSYEYKAAPVVHPYANYGSSNYTDPISPKVQISDGNIRDKRESNHESHYKILHANSNIFGSEPLITNSLTVSTPSLVSVHDSENNSPQIIEEILGTENKQKEVKVIKTQEKTESVTEEQNGDTDIEAAVTVKLPGKKSAAKTETKVDVVKKVLPDGSVEEVKTTTTKTTIDGKTEITTKTETTIIPKEDDFEEEEVVEEEEEEEQENYDNRSVDNREDSKKAVLLSKNQEDVNDKEGLAEEKQLEAESDTSVTKQQESSETCVTKKVTIVQSSRSQDNSEEEIEEEEEQEDEKEEDRKDDEEEIQIKNKEDETESNKVLANGEAESDDEDFCDETGDKNESNRKTQEENESLKDDEQDNDVESEAEEEDKPAHARESEEKDDEKQEDNNSEQKLPQSDEKEDEAKIKDISQNQDHDRKEEGASKEREPEESNNKTLETSTGYTQENKEEIEIEVQVLKQGFPTKEERSKESTIVNENEFKPSIQTEQKIPLREPSVPLEKVEDVEIKPIGQIISKSHTENTEIITTSIDKPVTGLSTQTAYNRIENIVTVNRTTKTLDHAYEQIAQHSVPMVKTTFVPNLETLSTSPQLSRPYQPVYPPEPQPERRHSLLLDRLSVDRQMPPTELYQNNYQFNNQNYDQNQWSQEPQSEVLTVSNVKPSTITKNQQWYQQTKREDVSYNTPAPTLNVPTQQWNSQLSHSQPLQHTQPQTQTNYQSQPQYQPSYLETQDSYKTTTNNSSMHQQNSYPGYIPKPTNWVNNNVMPTKTPTPTINKLPTQFSYTDKDTADNYSKPTTQFSSSYVPPPWEQDSNFVPDNINQTYYTPPPSNKFTINTPTKWAPSTENKFSKPKPTSYIPPAPNQSFVKPLTAVDLPKLPGRKTYYSEYERRYISVPESTYIPTENKFQAQPDPSPQYYYDSNEPSEAVEHEWRKELREFSEKTQTQSQSGEISVKPPWEEDPKYYVPKVTTEYTPTPTWSQTLRPNSWRERSFESEFVRSKELPRTNTLGRGRPQSSYVKSNISAPIPERPRGVSVDRYNSNTYKSPVPSEYPPVSSHTLDPSIGSKAYHNPNVPAYHSRASAEPREQSAAIPQARQWGEARTTPIQSRSFKYLQWITGTED